MSYVKHNEVKKLALVSKGNREINFRSHTGRDSQDIS